MLAFPLSESNDYKRERLDIFFLGPLGYSDDFMDLIGIGPMTSSMPWKRSKTKLLKVKQL
jgi:hypothetical protein